MILDALKWLAEQSVAASKPITLPCDTRVLRVLVGGEAKQFVFNVGPRDHRPGSLVDLIALAKWFHAEDGDAHTPVVWYDRESVVMVINDEADRDQRATLALQQSDLFARIVKLGREKTWFDQKAFLRLLRVELAGTLAPGVLYDKLRRLKIDNGQVTSSEVGRGKESLGRSIESKVTGEGEIPEDVTLMLPVYKTAGEATAFPLRCTVELEPMSGTPFRLMPLPDEIERVEGYALASIADRLSDGLEDAVKFYYGKP